MDASWICWWRRRRPRRWKRPILWRWKVSIYNCAAVASHHVADSCGARCCCCVLHHRRGNVKHCCRQNVNRSYGSCRPVPSSLVHWQNVWHLPLSGQLSPKHLPPKAGVTIINASAYRPIGRYRRSKHRKSMTSLKLVADTKPRQLTLNWTLTLTPICTAVIAPFQPEINIHHVVRGCYRSSLFWTPVAADGLVGRRSY